MKNNEKLSKFANNKKLLFITPHLIYISAFLSMYMLNQEIIFFQNFIILLLIFFTITTILHIILNKITKNNQYTFYILFFICLIYTCEFNLSFIIQFLFYGAIILIVLIKMNKNNLNACISIIIFIIFAYFLVSTPKNVFSLIINAVNTKTYKETYTINVDDSLETPNIYWIHADAMMNFEDMKKYFDYDNQEFLTYLKKEGYYVNESASLVAGHKTQKALGALFNPNYYDNFLKNYLYELEDTYLEKEAETSFNISTKELANKRIESELLKSLKEKEYTTISISKSNNYSTIKSDIFYDFFNHPTTHWHFTEGEYLRKIKAKDNNINLINLTSQLKEILAHSVFSFYTNDFIPYDYDLIDYNDLDTSDYSEIDKTKFWPIKAILKSLEETKEIDSKKFVFIDYDLNHTELSFDSNGNELPQNYYMNLDAYDDNYIYSCKLLTEMLNYIKTNDPNAIIIVQGDHGLHTFENDVLKEELNITTEELQEIRNSVINAVYIPKKYQNGEEAYLENPLNISRYIVNNYIGKNYEYLEY